MIAFPTFQHVHMAFCINEVKFWRRKRVRLLTSLKVSSRGEGVGNVKNRNARSTPLPHAPWAFDRHMRNPNGHNEVSLNFLRFSWKCGRGGGGVHFTSFFVCHLDNRKSLLGFQALSISSKHGNSNILIVFAGQFWQGGGDIETFALQNQPVRWKSSAGEEMLIVLYCNDTV